MLNRLLKICFFVILLTAFSHTYAQSSKRWRLDFSNKTPQRIIVTDPDGSKKVYWYVQYKVINNSNRDLPYSVNIRLVIDKPGEDLQGKSIPESRVPNIFYNARIPASLSYKLEGDSRVSGREKYLYSLKTYYDSELPLVKKAILSRLGIYPKLSAAERAIFDTLTQAPQSVFDIAKSADISYSEAEYVLNTLTINNFAISQEVQGSPTFVKGTRKAAVFWENGNEVKLKKGDTIAGWKLMSFSKNRAVVEKNGTSTVLGIGSGVEYLYSKSGKTPFEQDAYHVTGLSALGVYGGRTADGKQKYSFKRSVITKNSVYHGIAIFNNVSSEADFMAVVVSGLVDPIARRFDEGQIGVYAHNEVLISGYKSLGDEFSTYKESLVHLYKQWEILSSKEIRRYE